MAGDGEAVVVDTDNLQADGGVGISQVHVAEGAGVGVGVNGGGAEVGHGVDADRGVDHVKGGGRQEVHPQERKEDPGEASGQEWPAVLRVAW